MTAGCTREARDLAAHGDGVEARLQSVSNGAAQRPNCPDSGRQPGSFGEGHATVIHKFIRWSMGKYEIASLSIFHSKCLILLCFLLLKIQSICQNDGFMRVQTYLRSTYPQSYPQKM
jgi:hypothetical protein